ncbi:MAG: hypothetical protein JNL87_11320 [Burkholderiaceae bacterium]|nr:hypothetical protein [Burkholderiaceae bacterium]
MPIEIRELVIRATIASTGDAGPRGADEGGDAEGRAAAPLDVEAIVQECVRQVLRVLAREKER